MFLPCIYINGIKMQNYFDLQEIKNLVNGNIKKGDKSPIQATAKQVVGSSQSFLSIFVDN